ANPLGLPPATQQDTPLGTLDTSSELLTLGQDFNQGVCAVAGRQFGGGRAVITDKWASGTTRCEVQYGFANQWLQYLADCLAGAPSRTRSSSRPLPCPTPAGRWRSIPTGSCSPPATPPSAPSTRSAPSSRRQPTRPCTTWCARACRRPARS